MIVDHLSSRTTTRILLIRFQSSEIFLTMNCAVPGCTNTDENRFLRFYPLPYEDKEVHNEWIRRIGNPDLYLQHVDTSQPSHKICEIHFHYVCKTGLNLELYECSLPTLHLPIQSNNCFFQREDANVREQAELNEKINIQKGDCSDICRICYNKGVLYNIHESKYRNDSVFALVETLIQEKLPNVTDFPKQMCLCCIQLAIISNLMLQRIKNSNLTFSKLAKHLSKKSTKGRTNGRKSFSITYPPKIDIKTILADCNLKIITNKSTNYNVSTIIDIKNEITDSEKLHDAELLNCDTKNQTDRKSNAKCTEKDINKMEEDNDDNFFNIASDKFDKIYFKEESFMDVDKNNESEKGTSPTDHILSCSDCGFNFPSNLLLRQHKNTKHPIFCIICGKMCKSRKTLQRHMENHEEMKTYECRICPKKYKRIKGLSAHIKTHGINYREFLLNGTTENDILNMKNEKGKLCAICGKVVTYMKQHMYQHNEDSKIFKCQYCDYSSYCKFVIKRHEDSHTGTKHFLCTQCGRAYSSKMSLREHTKDHEHLLKPIQCLYCEETFNTKYDRQIHAQRHGVKLRAIAKPKLRLKEPSKCPQCGMTFANDSFLQVHLKNVHNVIDASCFSCRYCSETFTSGYIRSQHVTRQHRLKEVKAQSRQTFARLTAAPRFSCTICSKREATKSGLRVHMRVHTGERPYKCDVCPSAFKQQQQMKNHKRRMHCKERPFPCKLCDRAFNTGQELGEHARTHTGETVQCEYCDKTFKQRSNRSKHMREVHNIRIRGKYARQHKQNNDDDIQ